MLGVRARGRVGRLELVDVDPVPLVVVFVVVLVLVRLFGRVVVLGAARQDLHARRVLVFAVRVLGARMVVDGDSFPESEGHVSVAVSSRAVGDD
jgi:hypothetical protein